MPRVLLDSCVLLLVHALAAGCQPAGAPEPPRPTTRIASDAGQDPERTARAFVEALARHEWQGGVLLLDAALTSPGKGGGATPETLETFWKPLESEGPFRGIAGVAIGKRGPLDIALVVCRFGDHTRVVRLTITGEQRIAGLFTGSLAELAEPDSRAFVAALAAHDSASAHAMFGPELRAKVSETDLVALWQNVEKQAGVYQTIERVHVVTRDGLRVYVHARFAKGKRVLMLGYNGSAELVGLKVLPEGADPGWETPPYATPAAFSEKVVGLGMPPVPGILTLPTKPANAPVVVLIHRDGPQDEDESIGALRPFKDLAWGLATRGIAVLRYRKQSLAELPGGATEQEEVITPALSVIEALRKMPGIDSSRVFVLGHGRGGALAPLVAREAKVQGVVVLAGPTQSLQDNLVEQFTYLSSLDPSNATLRGQVESWKRLKGQVDHPGLRADARIDLPTGGSVSGSYFLFARSVHPTATAASLSCPIFVAQGDRDFQVKPAQLDDWKGALAKSPRATFKLYPGLGHLFVAARGEKPSPADYEGSGHVDEQVITDIASWLAAIKR